MNWNILLAFEENWRVPAFTPSQCVNFFKNNMEESVAFIRVEYIFVLMYFPDTDLTNNCTKRSMLIVNNLQISSTAFHEPQPFHN
jgi:hypothetical protein